MVYRQSANSLPPPIRSMDAKLATDQERQTFSSGAPPIQFGVAVRRDGGGAYFRFGKVNIEITGVPEPSSLSLAAITIAIGAAQRRRKQCLHQRCAAA
jgi:hypothetical protein